jgi:hypothetical protein
MLLLLLLHFDDDVVVEWRHSRAVVHAVYANVIVLRATAYFRLCSYSCLCFLKMPLFPLHEDAHFTPVVLPQPIVHLHYHSSCALCM